jgi:hypothetical protein
MNTTKRRIVSVSFREEEWEFVQKSVPEFTNISKLLRTLVLKHFNYPAMQENKQK